MDTYENTTFHEFPTLGVVSTWFGVALILVTAVGRIAVVDGNVSGTRPLLEGMQFVLMAFILASLLYLFLRGHRLRLAAVPLVINVGTLIIVRLVPFETTWQELRFQWHWSSYNEVVNLVEQGAIQPDEDGLAPLPARYRHLSQYEGKIQIERNDGVTGVFFFQSYHSPQNFSGYLYRSDDILPQAGKFSHRWRHVVQKRPRWFFCAST